MSLSNKEDLISIGEKIVSNFQAKLKHEKKRDTWKEECIQSCEIILSHLKSESEDVEKILLLAKSYQERHENSKPPLIPYWCTKISDYYSSEDSSNAHP